MDKAVGTARRFVAGGDDLISGRKEFAAYVEDHLYDELDGIGERNGYDVYLADTNGNDDAYMLLVYAGDDGLYYCDAVLTEDDVERDGTNASPELDDSRLYPCEKYPFNAGEFSGWLADAVKDGVAEGIKVFNSWKYQLASLEVGIGTVEGPDGTLIYKADIPNWSLSYLVNGDASGLDDDDLEEIEEWQGKNKVSIVDPTDETDGFVSSPEFGDACDCTVCFVHCRK